MHVMKRWARLLAVALAVMTTAAVGLAGSSPQQPGPVAFSTDRVVLVAVYRLTGGMEPMWDTVLDVPALLVYSNGLVIANARRTLRLSTAELTRLVQDLRRDLTHQPHYLSTARSRHINDGGDTELAVRLTNGTLRSVTVNQLHDGGYSHEVLHADKRLNGLFTRTNQSAAPFTSDRVRLVLFPPQAHDPAIAEQTAVAWPPGLPEPPPSAGFVRSVDLDPNATRAATAALPDATLSAPWRSTQPYRLADGSLHEAMWRYLAPDENTPRN
jgi:hypothetical protein